jgi:hypothetical protein
MPQSQHQPGPIVHQSRIAPASVDLTDAVAQGVRAGFGVLSLGLEVALRTLGESPAAMPAMPRKPGPRMPVSDVVDLMVGTAWGVARLTGRLAVAGARITAPVLDLVLRPPLVPRRLQPGYTVQLVTERWQRDRPQTLAELERLSTTALPRAVDAALAQVDMERLVTVVLDRMDLTKITTDVLGRLDVDQVAAQLLSQLEVDEVAAQLLSQLDVDEVAAQLLSQLDLTQLVLDRVDLQRVVAGALERLDLTAIVVDQVDLGDVVSAALQHVDLTEIVMRQVDLIGVAQYVVEGIDLPEIIRDSTGSVASEAVVGLRMQGIDADLVVGRVVDRMLRRRRHRQTEEVQGRLSLPDSPPNPPAGKPA